MRRTTMGVALAGLLLAGCEDKQPAQRELDGATALSEDGRILPGYKNGAAGDAAAPVTDVAEPEAPPPAAAPAAAAATGATLPDGEYACYGSGGTVLAGLGFKVSGGSYTDLDGKNPGTVAVDGSRVVFTGGHMSEIGGGRGYSGKSFQVGSMASCEKW